MQTTNGNAFLMKKKIRQTRIKLNKDGLKINVFLKFIYYFLNIKFSLTIKKFNSIQRGVIIIISHFIILSAPTFYY